MESGCSESYELDWNQLRFRKTIESEAARWREILRCILDVTLFLSSHNLAFRGDISIMNLNVIRAV